MANSSGESIPRIVAEIMQRDIVAIPIHHTMAEAAAALLEHGQASAPVIDEKGHCVGILTSEHFLRHERALEGEPPRERHREDDPSLLRPHRTAPFHLEECRADLVSAHMLPSVQSVAPDESIATLARIMVATQLHRLPVLDESSHPVGMVTALAVLAAMTRHEQPPIVLPHDGVMPHQPDSLPAEGQAHN